MIIDINLLKFLKYYYSWENSSWANIFCDLLQNLKIENRKFCYMNQTRILLLIRNWALSEKTHFTTVVFKNFAIKMKIQSLFLVK